MYGWEVTDLSERVIDTPQLISVQPKTMEAKIVTLDAYSGLMKHPLGQMAN